jgi:hypothetical protein
MSWLHDGALAFLWAVVFWAVYRALDWLVDHARR